jgi:hypothetical protein
MREYLATILWFRSKMKSTFENWAEGFSTGLGIALTYQYLVTTGVRK